MPNSSPQVIAPQIIAVDAMGGDFAPEINVRGALGALQDDSELRILLVGDQEALRRSLKKNKAEESDRLRILHADEVITMEDHAASVVRKKKNSSIHVGLQLVKEGQAHAFISAGNSGAIMATSLMVLGRIADVERPAILLRFPTASGFVIMLDGGANVDCRASHLFQFAQMGSIYAESIVGLKTPRVGLLSNGSEEHKGNELTREAHALFKKTEFPGYIGYIEGYDIFKGKVDVIVCDGFVGNVSLKLAEGLASAVSKWFRNEFRRNVSSMVGVFLMRKLLMKFKNKFDYQPYGAAPLVGIDGMVLISHGSSSDVAIRNGILTAKRGVAEGFVEKLRLKFADHSKAVAAPAEKSS